MIRAVIFDMDGVLVDSEEIICRAAIAMFREHGVDAQPEDFLPFVGTGENRYLGGVAEKHGFDFDLERDKQRAYAIYAEIAHGRLEPLSGVHEFFARCEQRGLLKALATSADRVKMEINLREIGIPVERFDAAVNGLEVTHKKPHPEIFLTAGDRLGVPPDSCLVVEDAVNGVAAAKAAGMRCLALTTSFTETDLAGADWHGSTLADAPPAALEW